MSAFSPKFEIFLTFFYFLVTRLKKLILLGIKFRFYQNVLDMIVVFEFMISGKFSLLPQRKISVQLYFWKRTDFTLRKICQNTGFVWPHFPI